jgi:hypothetical protein
VVTNLPTRSENLLYLVCELEDAIEWSADLTAAVERRLEIIVQMVPRIARRDTSELLEG